MHTSVSTTKTKSTQKTNLEIELLTGSKNISDHVQDCYHTLFQRYCCTTVLGVINVDTWLKSWVFFFLSSFLSFLCVLELGISLPSCKQNLLALKGKQEPWPSFDTGMTMLLVLKNKHTWQAITVIAEIVSKQWALQPTESLSRSTLTQLTKVRWTDLRKARESISSILLAKAAKDDVEDVVLGARAQSGFVQGATHQLTVVHHNNCNKHMRATAVKHVRWCSWGLNYLTVCMTLCSHSLLATTTGPNAHPHQ